MWVPLMEIVGVAGDVAVEGRKRRGYYGHGTKESTDAVLAVTMAVAGGSMLDARMGRIGRLRSAACQTCPIVAALQLPYYFVRGVPGED